MFTKNAHHHHHTIESDRICRSGRSKISYWTFVCSGEYDVKRESAVNPLFFFFYTFGSLCNYISIVLLSIESFVFVYMCRVSVSNWCACRNKNKSFHSVYSPRILPFSIIYVEISVRCTWKGRKCHWQRLNNGEMPWKCKVLRGSVKPSLVILKFQLMLSWNINSRHFCVWEAFSCHCAFQQQMLAYWLSNHIKWGYLRPVCPSVTFK